MKDLSGQRFGRLIAVRPTTERKNGYIMWECQCDCGNIITTKSSLLTRGSQLSCGCLARERAPLRRTADISGMRFGKLVALRPTEEQKNGSVLWECVCDCGKTAYIQKTNLMKGNTRSCGCLRRESANRKPVRDLTGLRFGKLVVIGPTEQRKAANVVWECRCDCGNTTFVTTNLLNRGGKRSCGCLHQEYLKERVSRDLTGQRFGRLVAVKATEARKNHRIVWECTCDCGKTTYVATNLLIGGKAVSCGCLQKERKKKILQKTVEQVSR